MKRKILREEAEICDGRFSNGFSNGFALIRLSLYSNETNQSLRKFPP